MNQPQGAARLIRHPAQQVKRREVVLVAARRAARPPHCPREHQEGKETVRPARSGRRNTTAMSDQPASEHTTRRSGQLPAPRNLSTWAAEQAATLPPLTESQAAAVARLAAQLDASGEEPAT